jgi:hypothetical protein
VTAEQVGGAAGDASPGDVVTGPQLLALRYWATDPAERARLVRPARLPIMTDHLVGLGYLTPADPPELFVPTLRGWRYLLRLRIRQVAGGVNIPHWDASGAYNDM